MRKPAKREKNKQISKPERKYFFVYFIISAALPFLPPFSSFETYFELVDC